MASQSRRRSGMTLDRFLKWKRIDDQPYLEYVEGKIEERMAGTMRHSLLIQKFSTSLDRFAEPSRLGLAFPSPRCTFQGQSIVPDVTFLLDARIVCDDRGMFVDETMVPPDIHIEIRSPKESVTKLPMRLSDSVEHGCPLGWLVDPKKRAIEVYRPTSSPERLPDDGFLDASPVLPGFRLSGFEGFGWLTRRKSEAGPT
jgi:Uma2 family endonuclease